MDVVRVWLNSRIKGKTAGNNAQVHSEEVDLLLPRFSTAHHGGCQLASVSTWRLATTSTKRFLHSGYKCELRVEG